MALDHQRAGRLDQAARIYVEVIESQPDNPDAHNLLGVVQHQRGNHETAVRLLRKAIALNPRFAQAYSNLGVVLQEQDRLRESVVCHRSAVALTPDSPEANYNLGIALQKSPEAEEAVTYFRKALSLRPNYPEALRGLGNAFRVGGHLQEAADVFRDLTSSEKGEAEDHNILGILLKELSCVDEAISCYRRAIALNPDNVEAQHNLGHALLLAGQYEEGWKWYEKRFLSKGYTTRKREFGQPLWTGEPLDGKTILLQTEQGFGDSIQFIRFATTVSEQYDGTIIVECQPKLKSLFSAVRGINTVVAEGEKIPDFDVQAPLMSVPYILGTTLQTIPEEIPYITAENLPKPIQIQEKSSFKIGFLWAGSTMNKKGMVRTVEAAHFERLIGFRGTKFYSLQYGDTAKELRTSEAFNAVEDLSPYLSGFAETAAVLDQLDLIITIDTYLAHLAGAMGKPTWVLLPYSPDWRWLLDRTDSPWYPSLRLFRQPTAGDWDAVFCDVEDALRERLGEA
ncbi:MAG: tetratricopeptide repeat protein [Alphaproteobacteria bacterium]|nr:tetratricopeptide repeat protein [Alphaproteobacteria bacterium]